MAPALNEEILRMADIIKETVPAERIYLFGSYAYGTPGECSDYDFYVVLSDGPLTPHDAIRKIYRAFSDIEGRTSVDILARDAGSFDDRAGQLTLERKVANEGILLHEQDGQRMRMA